MARSGRRPGRSQTRQEILEAARRLFAAGGYDQTTIREVAEQAGVDSALVMHYFTSKEGLFRAAIDWPFDMDRAARQILEGDPRHMGERLVRFVCGVWEDETTRHPVTVILRNAVQREDAGRLAGEFMQREVLARLAAHTHDPDAPLRGSFIQSTIVGLVLMRYVIKMEPLASVPVESVVRVVGSTIQRYLTEDIESMGGGPGSGPVPAGHPH